MEKSYRNVSYFFVIILIVVLWGFYATYYRLFPTFRGINNVQHIHGLLMLFWFALLIIQPLLIRYKKLELHKLLGKVSYFLAPLILISIFMVARMGYLRDAPTVVHSENLGMLSLSIPFIFGFAILYLLAIINKKKVTSHMRYMIATALFLSGAGIGRAAIHYGGISFSKSIEIETIIPELVFIGLIFYDLIKHRPYTSYVISLSILIVIHICWEFKMAWWWQAFAEKFVNLF